jgi:hypothetical protein
LNEKKERGQMDEGRDYGENNKVVRYMDIGLD